MAKSEDVGPFERHVEKAILAALVAVLTYGIIHWAVGSPRTVQVPSRGRQKRLVTPDQLDGYLLDEARRIDQQHQVQSRPMDKPKDPRPKFADLREGPDVPPEEALRRTKDRSAERVAQFAPKRVAAAVKQIEQITPAPATAHVEMRQVLPKIPGRRLADVDVAHVATTWDLRRALEAWRKKLRAQIPVRRIVVLQVELERQERRPGASWERLEPQRIEGVTAAVGIEADGKMVLLRTLPEIPQYNGKNRREIEAAFALVRGRQSEILQPDFFPVWNPRDGWVDWWQGLFKDFLRELWRARSERDNASVSKDGSRDSGSKSAA